MNKETVNFVAEVNPNIKDSDPSCHVCGAAMVFVGGVDFSMELGGRSRTFWKCLSCGTTTECT